MVGERPTILYFACARKLGICGGLRELNDANGWNVLIESIGLQATNEESGIFYTLSSAYEATHLCENYVLYKKII